MNGGTLTQLVPRSVDVGTKHDWSPSGDRLVFTDNADNLDKSANIATVQADGTGLRYLTHYRNPQLRAYSGSYSPDGRWIVYRLEDHGTFSLYRMRPDGSTPRLIVPPSDFKPRYIDWGPTPSS
jgi:Tol biopolymer transport system component